MWCTSLRYVTSYSGDMFIWTNTLNGAKVKEVVTEVENTLSWRTKLLYSKILRFVLKVYFSNFVQIEWWRLSQWIHLMRKPKYNTRMSCLTEALVQMVVVKFKSAFTARDKKVQLWSQESVMLYSTF